MEKVINSQAIGVFDSGIGGLTVVKTIRDLMPQENIIYFGDIARIPYGNKSAATLQKFARQTSEFLMKNSVKVIVIACNTITAAAKDIVVEVAQDIPVIDVIHSGVQAAYSVSRNNRVGIIGTSVTISSNIYPDLLNALNNNLQVFSQACPLFVPFIEEGILDHKALALMAEEYFQPLILQDIDTLILGCTHYPLIENLIRGVIGNAVTIIDPALETAKILQHTLKSNNLLTQNKNKGVTRLLVTDIPRKLEHIASLFLDTDFPKPELVIL